MSIKINPRVDMPIVRFEPSGNIIGRFLGWARSPEDDPTCVQTVAHLQRAHGINESRDKGGHDIALHVEAIRSGACLSTIAHLCDDGPLHSRIDVSVVQHDEWCVTTEFH